MVIKLPMLLFNGIFVSGVIAQEEMRRYTDRKRGEVVEYKVGDLVLLSTRDLKWQMVGRSSEKLVKQFVGPYKIKAIISSNVVELELPATIKIHPVMGVTKVRLEIIGMCPFIRDKGDRHKSEVYNL